MRDIFTRFLSAPALGNLAAALATRDRVSVAGAPEGARALLAIWAARQTRRPVLLVCRSPQLAASHLDTIADVAPELPRLSFDPESATLTAWLAAAHGPSLAVATTDSLSAPAPVAADLPPPTELVVGTPTRLEQLVRWLEDNGYERSDLVTEPGEYAVRGGIVDVFSDRDASPLRIELGGDVVVSLRVFDPLTQRSLREQSAALVPTQRRPAFSDQPASSLVPAAALVMAEETDLATERTLLLVESADGDLELGFREVGAYLGNTTALRDELEHDPGEWFLVSPSEHHRERLARLLGPRPRYVAGTLAAGFASVDRQLTVITEREIYGAPATGRVRHRFKGLPVDNLVALRPGDHIVHVDYGIGRFEGTCRLTHAGIEKDYLVLRYAGPDRAYVPVENLGLIDRYVGSDDQSPALDRLGGRTWLAAKARVARESAEYARELLEHQARRAVTRGTGFPPDSVEQVELEASFRYEETPDQLKALAAVKRDMEQPRPMDRLICGDVGFGKTEVALRAAFKAASNLKQVAVLAPTTILCYQHYRTFRRRLERFPLRVEMLSRFVPPARRRETVSALATGQVDIIIGTHLLLGANIRFRDLGLLVIDEEQKFGVRQKERLRALKAGADILTLTATPIPRTLYMALAGLRDISSIHTPPPGRREIRTEVSEWHDDLIREHVFREVNRGGQVFFVHNEIQTIEAVHRRLARLLPGLKLTVAHGRMHSRRLADIYLAFAAGEFQVLLSTAIVESGLDMPNVNTIIVNQADRFGLADLHQLRGRVGRSSEQAFALFLIPSRREIAVEARKRLSALLAYSQLGAGYKLALRDMEIRGVGNILGLQQHGHVARIGFSLYTRMLKEAISRLRGEPVSVEPELSLDVPAYLPAEYVPDAFERVALYKRLLGVESESELEELRAELIDRFGRYPPLVENLFRIALVRVRCRARGILRVSLRNDVATVIAADRTETVGGGIVRLLDWLGRS